MKFKYITFFFILIFSNTLHAEGKFTNEYLNNILQNSCLNKNIRVLQEGDLKIDDYKKEHKYYAEKIYNNDLKAYRNGEFRSYLKGDFNSNGKIDIALSCVVPFEKQSYLVILETNGDSFKCLKLLKFKNQRLFIFAGKQLINFKKITVCFQSGTDWCEIIVWNGRDFIVKEKDPYGP